MRRAPDPECLDFPKILRELPSAFFAALRLALRAARNSAADANPRTAAVDFFMAAPSRPTIAGISGLLGCPCSASVVHARLTVDDAHGPGDAVIPTCLTRPRLLASSRWRRHPRARRVAILLLRVGYRPRLRSA